MTRLERLIERGLLTATQLTKRLRRRVLAIARKHRDEPPTILLAKVRAELQRAEPRLARGIQLGLLAAWLAAAQRPAKELPAEEVTGEPARDIQPVFRDEPEPPLIPLGPPGPPFGPLFLAPPGDDAQRPVRWPAIEAAARDLLSRRAVSSEEFTTLGEDARRTAFTITGVTSIAVVDAVKDAIANDVLHGGTLREFRAAVGAALDEAGLREHEVETVYRTHTGLARAAGLRAVLGHELVADEFPYAAWHATHDGRVRPDHLAMETAGIDGTNVYRCDDPAIQRAWPPCGYNCRCIMQPMSIEQASAEGVREARRWLTTGEPPVTPTWVGSVPVQVPSEWPATRGGRLAAAV